MKVDHTVKGLEELHFYLLGLERQTRMKPPIVLEATGHVAGLNTHSHLNMDALKARTIILPNTAQLGFAISFTQPFAVQFMIVVKRNNR